MGPCVHGKEQLAMWIITTGHYLGSPLPVLLPTCLSCMFGQLNTTDESVSSEDMRGRALDSDAWGCQAWFPMSIEKTNS